MSWQTYENAGNRGPWCFLAVSVKNVVITIESRPAKK